MSNDPPPPWPFRHAFVQFIALWVLATPSFPSDSIYTYADDDGIPHFTDQWQLIPDKYRSRVQQLDPSTGKPFKPEAATPARPRSAPPPALARKDRAEPAPPADRPFYAAWLDGFSKLSIPRPSPLQLGVGLTSVVLAWGAFRILRMSANPIAKLVLKGMLMACLLGGAYVLYVASLKERLSNATENPAPQRITGQEIIQTLQGATQKAVEIIKEKAGAPLEKIKDATTGEAVRARDLMNESNRETEQTLKKIESDP